MSAIHGDPVTSRDQRTSRDLRLLPKAHLHVHLEAAMRQETYEQLCAAGGEAPARLAPTGGFTEFGALYRSIAGAIRSRDDLARLTEEAVMDAAADGAVWFEPQLLPEQHRPLFGHDGSTIDFVSRIAQESARRAGIAVGLMIVANREAPPQEALQLARLAAERKGSGVVSFGLAGDERYHPGAPFQEAFHVARDGGLICAPHAGELRGAGSVREAAFTLRAHRIQHGVRAVEDPGLLTLLREADICLDVCPTSNVALGVVAGWDHHPLPILLDSGISCSLNADDPLMFGVGVLGEYERARERLFLTDAQLAGIAAASLRHSGAPNEIKRAGAVGVEQWLAKAEDGNLDV